jgi:hypothetical protein
LVDTIVRRRTRSGKMGLPDAYVAASGMPTIVELSLMPVTRRQ